MISATLTSDKHLIYPYPNGFGTWCAQVTLAQPLTKKLLTEQLPTINAAARAIIVAELTQREQKTHETFAQAEGRVQASVASALRLVHETANAEDQLTTIILCE